MRGIFYREKVSWDLKKNAISFFAFSALSEPCTALRSIDFAKSARIVPGAASLGLVDPMSSRFFAIAFSPSKTETKTGPSIMKVTSSRKKGFRLF
jgi:hypothetical protein